MIQVLAPWLVDLGKNRGQFVFVMDGDPDLGFADVETTFKGSFQCFVQFKLRSRNPPW